jgi:hypothetical protein
VKRPLSKCISAFKKQIGIGSELLKALKIRKNYRRCKLTNILLNCCI